MPPAPATCRLCEQPLGPAEMSHRLCSICDEYVQHLSLRGNRSFEDVVSDLRNAPSFAHATRRAH